MIASLSVPRLALAATGLGLSLGAYQIIGRPDILAEASALSQDPAHRGQAVPLLKEALRRDNANPYRWADLADALDAEGDSGPAKKCYDRAIELAPGIPQIWVRHANFALSEDDIEGALHSAARVLEIVPDFDGVLFTYFDRILETDSSSFLAAVSNNRRATRSWFTHTIEVNNPAAARLAWAHITSAGYGDDELAASYAAYLLRINAPVIAQSMWSSWLADRRGDFPLRNLLYNGDLRLPEVRGPFDWQLAANNPEVETTREGQNFRIRFTANSNLSYDGLFQTAVLPQAGPYRLSARIKVDQLTTDQGIRLAIPDLNLETEGLTGTHGWTTVGLDFVVQAPRAIRVALKRTPSRKFDNKVQGTAWATGFNLPFTARNTL